jgi:hypothetical protein
MEHFALDFGALSGIEINRPKELAGREPLNAILDVLIFHA